MTNRYSQTQYRSLYEQSISDPSKFWRRFAVTELEWFQPFMTAFTWKYPYYSWFDGGMINITHNCLDRHIAHGNGDRIAYIYNNELDEEESITYAQLLARVNQVANMLQKYGIQKGDRVVIYMPLTIDQIAIMLACARMGAIHSVVYAGFSAEALAIRIKDTQAKIVCTATWMQKNGKQHDLLMVVREAVKMCPSVKHVIVMQRKTRPMKLQTGESDLHDLLDAQSKEFAVVPVESSTPLFILYTSGTTGTPKGIVHAHGGYNLYSHMTFKYNFAIQESQVHWTVADTGWITGHSYIVYGPLSNGVTSILYEGGPAFPNPDRYWELVDKYQVQSFYTAPTVIRMLMREGEVHPNKHKLKSLRVIGSVGEPINPAAWQWYSDYIGKGKASVIDTWWQTETGGHMLVTPPAMKQKPGSAGLPFLGIQPSVVDDDGNEVTQPNVVGHLVIKHPWPGALLTCWNNEDRFVQYWSEFGNKQYFFTGDVAQKDSDQYYMVLGRADDVINVGGVRISTAEVESALVSHESVAEAAAIGISDLVKGEAIKVFVVLNQGVVWRTELKQELKKWVRKKIGYIAEPADIEQVDTLPKTRSGKIMRRILKAKEMGLQVGDTSTMEE
ncbi:acetate--CoA ligase [Candidatus Woesebacteria bacterium]|nr:acetate--CoA ligase [Candidatus Woesebacteria bacterium]